MLVLDGPFEAAAEPGPSLALGRLAGAVFALAFLIAVANAVTTFLMCGLARCPDDPTSYLLLR